MSKIKKLRTRCFFDVSIAEDNVGRIVFELFNDVCPKTCENFRALCTGERGLGKFTGKPLHYKDVAFHRIVKDFIIQSGDFSQGNGKGGESIYGGTFEDESFHFKHEKPFLLSMANRGKNTNGSQFFITLAPAPHLDGVHVVYGHVIAGQDTVLKIANQAVDKNSKPLVNVRISNCGELIPQIKSKDSKTKRTKEMSGSEDSDSDSDDSSSNSDDSGSDSSSSNEGEIVDDKTSSHKDKISKDNKTDDNLELDKTAPESDEPKYFSTVKPEEVPEIPPNRFLMRSFENKDNDNNRDTEKSKNEGKQPAKFDRSYSKRILYTKSGRKIKGRGFVRFRTPSPDRGRSQRSETPPHWKLATQKLKTLKEAIEEQSHNSHNTDFQYSGRNDNRRFNGRQQRFQRSRSRSPHNNNRHDNRRRDYSPDSKRSDRISNQNHYQQRNRSRSTSVEFNRPMHQDNPEEQKNKVIEEGEIDESIDNSRLSKANSLIESKREFNRKRVHSPNRDKPYRERSRSASVDKNRTKELKQSAQLNKGDTSIVAGSKDKPAQKHHDRKLSKLETRLPESRKSRSRSPIRKKHDRNRSRSLSIDSSRAKKQKDNAEDSRIKETTQTNIVRNNNDSRLENRKLSRRDQSPLESVNRTRSPTNNRFQSRRYRSRSASFDNLSKDIANKTTTIASSAKTDNKKVVKDTDKDSKRTEIKKDLRRSPDYSKLSSDSSKRSPSPDRSKQQRKRSRSSSFVVDRNKDHSRKDDKNIKKDKKDEFRKEENRRDDSRDAKLHPQYTESKRNDRNRSSRSPYDQNRKKSHRNRSRSSSVGNNKRAHESKDNNNETNKKLDNGKHNRKPSLDRAENGHSSKKSISEVTASGSSSHRHGHSSHHKESHHQERTHRQSKHTRHSSPRNISPSR